MPTRCGKTTPCTITGLLQCKDGNIEFEGKDITRTRAHDIVKLGMAHVPEGRRVFGDLTVLENRTQGIYEMTKTGIRRVLKKIYKEITRTCGEENLSLQSTLSGGEATDACNGKSTYEQSLR